MEANRSWEGVLFQHFRKHHHPDERSCERERRRLAGINLTRTYHCYRCPKCGHGHLVGTLEAHS